MYASVCILILDCHEKAKCYTETMNPLIKRAKLNPILLSLPFVLLSPCHALESKEGLEKIGMPINGVCTGSVYISGDGELWNWDIFNIKGAGPGGGGDLFYRQPMVKSKPFVNGFYIKIMDGASEVTRSLNSEGFSDIEFHGQYPVAHVTYRDKKLPVTVSLQALTPFIPTNIEESSYPAIYMDYTVTNRSNKSLRVELFGQMQNMSCFQTGKDKKGWHVNSSVSGKDFARLELGSEETDENAHADWGSMSLSVFGSGAEANATLTGASVSHVGLGEPLVGEAKRVVELKAGESKTVSFLITWDFPNIHLWNGASNWINKDQLRHYYSRNIKHAGEVATLLMSRPELKENTLKWVKTWYDSTLPKDLLDRSFLNVSTMATNVFMRFDDLTDNPKNEGRLFNEEGVYLGPGTCRHVSHYGQVLGRVFPSLARQRRSQVDFGLALSPEGIIGYRGEFSHFGHHDGRGYAVDGQAGTILAAYREHLMAPDDSFIKSIWPQVKKAMQYMILHDKGETQSADGLLEGAQYNTLDRIWYGKHAWLSGLYNAALLASAEMAVVVNDTAFAKECLSIAEKGKDNISKQLFNGEYFIQILDPQHLDAPNSNKGCHIDQMLGQYWAHQLGLGLIVEKKKLHRALSSLMKYNFINNYGEFLKKTHIPISRWYAEGAEQGVVMCSFPKGGADKAPGKVNNDWEKLVVGYFSEMWTGQEYALAALMIDEGKIAPAMKILRAIDDRYAASKRNPYNEIEYGNHYSRAMSSYALFVSACSYYHNGPEQSLGFAPKILDVDGKQFKAAFIASQGWGSYEQEKKEDSESYKLTLEYGSLPLQELILPCNWSQWGEVTVLINQEPLEFTIQADTLILSPVVMTAGDSITIVCKK